MSYSTLKNKIRQIKFFSKQKRLLNKQVLLVLLIWNFNGKMYAQQLSRDIYENENYHNAVHWLNENRFISDSLAVYGVPPDEAIAVVFPELMRYSALEDKMEVMGLMVLYVRLGKDYADFSVGYFQMKPSFVRQLEVDARKYLSQKEIQRICPSLLHGEDTPASRRKRVSSLTNTKNEVSYLALFYKICLSRFKNIHFKDKTEKIRFLATAYNCGYRHSVKNLFAQMKQKQFPVYNRLLIYHENYADISLKWWESNSDHKMACFSIATSATNLLRR
jgi:hypothetical protein